MTTEIVERRLAKTLEVWVTTTIVKDAAGLTAALKAAQSGDVIKLAAGDYSAMMLTGLKFAGTVTVTSLDPSNMAALNGLILRNSENLKFQGLEFKVDPAKARELSAKIRAEAGQKKVASSQ